jgi:hypothetical protein
LFAQLVGVVVAFAVWILLARFGIQEHQAGDVSILYGLMAGFLTYGGRLVLCRCPRCGRRLLGLWTLLWLLAHCRGGRRFRNFQSLILTRCPHCDTRFRWTADGRPIQPSAPDLGGHLKTD